MKKIISVALIAVMLFACLAFVGCAPKANVENYTRSYAYYEEGREGDVIDAVVCDLTFLNDKEYLYTETTVIAHVGVGRQVTNWTYSFKGTYTVGATDEEETTKAITLSAPVSGWKVMNGAMTTAEEDPEIMAYNFPKALVLNYSNFVFDVAAE